MREHPILFSGPMVRAILDGSKIQTRRVMKPQIDLSTWPLKPGALEKEKEWRYMPRVADWHHIEENMWGLFNKSDSPSAVPYTGIKCPFGNPGDRLWVRETWRYAWINAEMSFGDFHTVQFKSGFGVLPFRTDWKKFYGPKVLNESWDEGGGIGTRFGKWRPSIHMPRWASRITLEVVSVRVERVQEISIKDCIAEGIDPKAPLNDKGTGARERDTFAELWDSINRKGSNVGCYSGPHWETNPWVWVVEFENASLLEGNDE